MATFDHIENRCWKFFTNLCYADETSELILVYIYRPIKLNINDVINELTSGKSNL